MAKTKLVFNTRTQQMEEAVVTIDGNGEFLFTFEDGSFFKLPATVTAEEVTDLLQAHKEGNEGQISLEAQEKVLDEILGETEEEEPTEEDVEGVVAEEEDEI